jgi:hypothetical protein
VRVPHYFIALGVAAAMAEPGAEPSLLGLRGDSEVPASCRGSIALAALTDGERLAITRCAAQQRLDGLAHLAADAVSITAIEAAVAPSFAVLAQLAASDDHRVASEAYDVTADLYVMMAARIWRELDTTDRDRVSPDVNRWLARADAALAAAQQLRRPPAR